MSYPVLLTDDAARDLEDLYHGVRRNDSVVHAEHVLKQIEQAIATLTELPERGCFPPELLAYGVREYREIFFKPYRLIYRVLDQHVYVYLIADGRRDMQSLLLRRLVGGV